MKKILLPLLLLWPFISIAAENKASITPSTREGTSVWLIENETLSAQIELNSSGQLLFTHLYNKTSQSECLTGNGSSSLFHYKGRAVAHKKTEEGELVSYPFEYSAGMKGWSLTGSSIEDILMTTFSGKESLGKRLSVVIQNEDFEVTICAEIYDGKSGLRMQNYLKNLTGNYRFIIEESTVLRLNLPNNPHHLHFSCNTKWESTTGGVEEAPLYNKGKRVAKVLLNRYEDGTGWYLAPEVNWRTQYGPEVPSSAYEYMHRSFAGATAWSSSASDYVQVITHPESFQLVLFPQEKFEYIAVNLTLFTGDIVDGKMAVEEHLRKRYKYHDTQTLFNTNDWDWFTTGKRTDRFYREVVIPKAKEAGMDMVMWDDGWNNPNSTNTGLDNSGTHRDEIVPSPMVTTDFKGLTDFIHDNGLMFGLWYSMSGGNHNMGFDLSDPAFISAKREKVRTLLEDHHMSHQMVDLTEMWQVLDETSHSYPSDNVYRKVVRTKNLMNELADKYPQYIVKVTSELDIHPTQGDRAVELLHIPYNGFMTSVGDAGGGVIGMVSYCFGHYPLNSVYFGGTHSALMEDYYKFMVARDIKFGVCPDQWSQKGIELMAKFNKWRRSKRIADMTTQIIRPVYLGKGWDSNEVANWDFGSGPLSWMYTTEQKDKALLISSNCGEVGHIGKMPLPIRWLDDRKHYLIEDITLDDTRQFTYHFEGVFTGADLKKGAFAINMYQNSSRGKAFWIQEMKTGQPVQVLYMNENVDDYQENYMDGVLTVTLKGKANEEALAILYYQAEDKVNHYRILLDENGEGELRCTSVPEGEEEEDGYPGFSGGLRYDLENLHDNLIFSDDKIKMSSVFNGNPDSEGGYSSFAGMNAVGDYVVYKLEIPSAGTYNISLNYKLSKSSRGECGWAVSEDNINYTDIGKPFSQATTGTEKMETLNMGDYTFHTSGTKYFKMSLTAVSSNGGKNLSTNYLKLTLQ